MLAIAASSVAAWNGPRDRLTAAIYKAQLSSSLTLFNSNLSLAKQNGTANACQILGIKVKFWGVHHSISLVETLSLKKWQLLDQLQQFHLDQLQRVLVQIVHLPYTHTCTNCTLSRAWLWPGPDLTFRLQLQWLPWAARHAVPMFQFYWCDWLFSRQKAVKTRSLKSVIWQKLINAYYYYSLASLLRTQNGPGPALARLLVLVGVHLALEARGQQV